MGNSRLASSRLKADIQSVLHASAWFDFSDELLSELLRIFNNSALDEGGGDIIGRIYEYFLNKFAITNNKIVIGRGLAAMKHKLGYQSYLYYLLKERFFKDDLVGNGAIFASITKS